MEETYVIINYLLLLLLTPTDFPVSPLEAPALHIWRWQSSCSHQYCCRRSNHNWPWIFISSLSLGLLHTTSVSNSYKITSSRSSHYQQLELLLNLSCRLPITCQHSRAQGVFILHPYVDLQSLALPSLCQFILAVILKDFWRGLGSWVCYSHWWIKPLAFRTESAVGRRAQVEEEVTRGVALGVHL